MCYLDTLKYWRNSLADASRPAIKLSKTRYAIDLDVDINTGKIDHTIAEQLILEEERRLNEVKGVKDGTDPDWESLSTIPVLFTVFYINSKIEHSKALDDENGIIPFLIRATLSKRGILRVPEDSLPYIARDYLEPLPPAGIGYVFSSVELVDSVLVDVFLEDNWTKYISHVRQQFFDLTGQTFDNYQPDQYEKIDRNIILVDEVIPAASDGIIALYDYLIHINEEKELLLHRLTKSQVENDKQTISLKQFPEASLKHLGQMGYEFPLSISQRQSLYEVSQMNDGDIFAVNGPPGTGKTTLLQSIVSNEVVTSAIRGGDPSLILACSTNNQAVTNIVESFLNVKTKSESLYSRWIPEVNSYALYLPSGSKKVSDKIPFQKLNEGIMNRLETRTHHSESLSYFRQRFRESFPERDDINDISDISHFLQSQLKRKQDQITHGVKLWQDYEQVAELISSLNYKEKVDIYDGNMEFKLKELRSHLMDFEQKKNNYFLQEPWWLKLFSFLPFVGRYREQNLRSLFRTFGFDLGDINLQKMHELNAFFEKLFGVIDSVQKSLRKWQNWKMDNHIDGNPPTSVSVYKNIGNTPTKYFFNELEMSHKNEMYFLAIHYWEARWLMAVEEALSEDTLWKTVGNYALDRWKRYSMLFPCFVSTFYMAPKFFNKLKFAGKDQSGRNKWEQIPLLSAIDYLIVDEAGQVTPEVGAATFGLGKKAVVVGDTLQIDPVWSVAKPVDKANLFKYDLAKDEDQYINYDTLGFLCSTGSIMKLAQKASPFKLKKDIARGLWLTEHRRCYDEIIGYCNALAYKGLLEPKKGNAPQDLILPPMAFIHHTSPTDPSKVSKSNRGEAEIIGDWLLDNQGDILAYYQQHENRSAAKENRSSKKLILGDVLAIITPFALQNSVLKQTMRNRGIEMKSLTIGTVHALQGAERSIVLFSSVYGSNMKGSGFFYDRGPNMLNVAVSRAKDSFIVFGHEGLYVGDKSEKPSSLLYRYIKG